MSIERPAEVVALSLLYSHVLYLLNTYASVMVAATYVQINISHTKFGEI